MKRMLEGIDDFALVIVRGTYVIRRMSKSQPRRAMDARTFQDSKTKISPDYLNKQARAV